MASLSPEEIMKTASGTLEAGGFECHPFLIKWYNDLVAEPFRLQYDDDTFCLIVMSTPSMFEKSFLEFIKTNKLDETRDPIDQCIANRVKTVTENFHPQQIDCFYDYEMHHNRRPKVLVQTAGHVAGGSFFYQRHHLTDDPWDEKKKICGVAVHPKYGGWFALRCVMIFKNLQAPELPRKQPEDILPENDQRVDVLEKFNFHWQDWTFRDVIPVAEKYSADQMCYFGTLPKNRPDLIERLRQGLPAADDNQSASKDAGHSFNQ